MTISIAERNFDVAGGLNHLAVGRNEAQPVHRLGDRHMPHLIILITNHRSEMAFVGQLHGFYAEARAQNSIKRRGRAAALQMSEHATARFLASALDDLTR